MTLERETMESECLVKPAGYRHMPLLELARWIAFGSDRMALNELHENRRVFRYGQEDSLRMAELLFRLKESGLAKKWTGSDEMAMENAYDLTIDKFSNLPAADGERQRAPETRGSDCRYYYRAFYEHVVARLPKKKRRRSQIKVEQMAVAKLQHMVIWHFHLSCLESRRRAQHLVRRYLWQKDGCTLGIWMPSALPGQQCRQWLETNVPDCDPTRVGERQRVQDIANRLLTRPRKIPLYAVDGGADNIAAPMDSVSSMIEAEISMHGLARTVAEEKAQNIDHQRPAIQALGKEKLEQLVLGIFDGLVRDECCAKNLADAFGLSHATLSRFAGRRWRADEGGAFRKGLPDLWQNTARILASHSAFVEAANQARLLGDASSILTSG